MFNANEARIVANNWKQRNEKVNFSDEFLQIQEAKLGIFKKIAQNCYCGQYKISHEVDKRILNKIEDEFKNYGYGVKVIEVGKYFDTLEFSW